MSFDDKYKISVHAAIFNDNGEVLQVKATYADLRWGLPGGSIDPGETIHDAIIRECQEELGCEVLLGPLTGVYYHKTYNSHVFIVRCTLPKEAHIRLSVEHSEYSYFPLEELNSIQKIRIQDCLDFDGHVKSAKF